MYVLGADPTLFPPVDATDEDGIIAVGGDLRVERLVNAYRRGIFPWYSEGLPILWHCPDPRFVLVPSQLHVAKSLRKVQKQRFFDIRFDTAFERVIDGCAKIKRQGQRGTWITRDMKRAYTSLFVEGLAHSAEAFIGDTLVGGLYGVSLGGVFFGESMFTTVDNASKLAFIELVEWLRARGIELIDCQQETAHLARFGAEAWPRPKFIEALTSLVDRPTLRGPWKYEAPPTGSAE